MKRLFCFACLLLFTSVAHAQTPASMRFNPSNTLRVCFPVGADFSQPIPLPPIPCPDDLVGSSAAPQAAPVPQAIQCAKLSPAGVGAYPSPLASYNIGFTSQTNATWTLEVTPTPPTITENGTPWGTNVAPGLYTALTTGSAESIQLAYNTPTYIAAELCEYPGQLTLDVAAPILTGTSQVAASNPLIANAGDLFISYGWQNTSNYLTVQPAAGFALEPSGT